MKKVKYEDTKKGRSFLVCILSYSVDVRRRRGNEASNAIKSAKFCGNSSVSAVQKLFYQLLQHSALNVKDISDH